MTQQLVYTATSEFRPVEDERLRVVVNRLTGQPISTFHHIDLFSPGSDTVMVEHDLEVKRGEISGRRRVGTRSGGVMIVPVSRPFAPGTVLSDYVFLAGAVSNAGTGDSPGDPVETVLEVTRVSLTEVAETPASNNGEARDENAG